jgi:multidrug resistance efflux pump
METPRHPYRKFVFSAASKSADGQYYSLAGAKHGRPIRLTPPEFELARLFDGARDATAVRSAALTLLGMELAASELERFANDLAQGDLLEPGRNEPLPVPPQTDAELAVAGWLPGAKAAGIASDAQTPSTVPNSLSGPGLPGSLTGLWGQFRGVAAPIRYRIGISWLLPLGSLLALPVYSWILLAVLLAASIGAVALSINHSQQMGLELLRRFNIYTLIIAAVGMAYLINFLSELARAAVIANATRAAPKFGLVIGLALIPRFHNDTSGPAESADRKSRMRIIGAGMVTQLDLLILGVLASEMFGRGGSLMAGLSVILALVSTLYLYLQINPLVKRDGYNLLLQVLKVFDLREQALYALFGQTRPWNEARRIPTGMLQFYGVLCALYIAWIVYWILTVPGELLQSYWGPAGVVVLVLLLAYNVYSVMRRARSQRSSIGGGINFELPSRLDWIIVGALAAVALFPYPYEPSGPFTVMPNAKADVRALTSGDVREVFVKEGDTVKAGQVIARIGDDEARAQVAADKAELLHLEANLAIARAGGKPEDVAAAKQEVATAAKRLQFSREEADRLAAAYKKNAVSAQDYQKALSIAEVNQQQLVEAEKRVIVVQSPARNDEIKAIEAEMARTQAQLDLHQKQSDDTQVKALIEGQVVSGSLIYAVGDYLQRGQAVATIEDTSKLLVEIKVSEDDAGLISVGDEAFAKAFGFPNAGYSGHVQSIAPSAENAQYGKVVRVMMLIDKPDGKLKPEMTGYAKASSHTYPLIVAFTRPVVRFFLVEFWSWLP